MSSTALQLSYLVAAVLFILGLRGLSSPRTAPMGNWVAAVGMLIAIVATLVSAHVVGWGVVIAGLVVGSAIGTVLAYRIQMTAMPQMVALLNGFGGGASALVASVELMRYEHAGVTPGAVVSVAAVAGALIGCVTFTGSVVAFAKLQEILRGTPVTYPLQRTGNAILGAGAFALCAWVALQPADLGAYSILVAVSSVLGVLLVIPIGGADMPVVISLLNSYSGLAACATGFVLGNSGLVISGSLVGASGIFLSKLMCDAMNRSLANVLFGSFGQVTAGGAAAGQGKTVRRYTPQDAAVILSSAHEVIVVPGYGLAVAQAQHAVRELSDLLEKRGAQVQFAIHPVAGRMPGHMNVLLAEADVPYEKLIEMDQINPQFPETDVVLVIGANDVVNPSARSETGSPIYGMPILDVDRARQVLVIKRSLSPGFAGVDNPLFYNDNTMMVFGDAKGTVLKIVEALRQL